VANYAINRAYAHAGTGLPPIVQPGHTTHAFGAVFGARLIYCGPLPARNVAAFAACLLTCRMSTDECTAPILCALPGLTQLGHLVRIIAGID
jgi:hypothetical protein